VNALRLAVACLAVLSARAALAQCSAVPQPDEAWTETYHDVATRKFVDYDTTFALTAPCKVFVDVDFVVTVTVTDNLWSTFGDRQVASGWWVEDTPEPAGPTTTLDYGTRIPSAYWSTPADGEYVITIGRKYQGVPVDHTLSFRFELGIKGMGWNPEWIGSLTVDPYLEAAPADPPPADPPPVDPPPVDPPPGDSGDSDGPGASPAADPGSAGGCSTAGTGAATLALLGLVAAALRRRR
jgi:MYXO-CTERM domain-containing protein